MVNKTSRNQCKAAASSFIKMRSLPSAEHPAKKAGAVSAVFLIFLQLMLYSSCASVGQHYAGIDRQLKSGNAEEAFDRLMEEAPSAYADRDALLFQLDAGMLAHYAGDYEESKKYLGEAERSIENLYAKSITLTAASYLSNDTITEYSGEDYEDVYINVFNALNYFFLGSTEGALVEIRRIDEKLKLLGIKYGTEITSTQEALLDSGVSVPYDSEAASVNFTNSALARYLGMLFYRSQNLKDDARIDRDYLKLAFANQPSVYDFKIPDSIEDELDIPQGKARLNVISFTGLSPEKQAEEIRIPITYGSSGEIRWIKISIPVLREKPDLVASAKVVFDTGEQFHLEVIEKMGAVAAETIKQNEALIYLKTILRATSKTTASIIFDEASQMQGAGNDMGLLFSLLSIGTQMYADLSEQADLRVSHYFPATAWVGGITLDPGIYSYSVVYYSASGKPVHQDRFENILVSAEGLNLSESICIK